MRSSGLFCLLLGALLLMVPLSSVAYPSNRTKGEVAALPQFCWATQDISGYGDQHSAHPDAWHWVSIMGSTFWDMHHYCGALIAIMRGEKADPFTRRALYESAVHDIDYSINQGIKKAGMKFILLPEMFCKRAEVLLRLKRDPEATQSYLKAIEAKPEYWPAYAGLARYYQVRGNFDTAREFAEQGLEAVPDSKTLTLILAELRAELRKSGAKSPPRKQEPARNKDVSKAPEPAPQQDAPKAQNPQGAM